MTKYSLTLYFVIAFAIPIVTTIAVVIVAGAPANIVINELTVPALLVMMGMVHAPTIAAMIVVFRSQRFDGVRILFRQLKHWRFAPQGYLKALLIFPATILAVLFALSLFSPGYAPVINANLLPFAAVFGTLWEEIGWTGFATPVMLKRFRPLKAALLLGCLHALWHLAASAYGSGAFHGNLFIVNFMAASVGIVGLRIVTIWIYLRTNSLVLGWLTHFSFTGGQLAFVSFALTSGETIVWNMAFSVAVLGVAVACWRRRRP